MHCHEHEPNVGYSELLSGLPVHVVQAGLLPVLQVESRIVPVGQAYSPVHGAQVPVACSSWWPGWHT